MLPTVVGLGKCVHGLEHYWLTRHKMDELISYTTYDVMIRYKSQLQKYFSNYRYFVSYFS